MEFNFIFVLIFPDLRPFVKRGIIYDEMYLLVPLLIVVDQTIDELFECLRIKLVFAKFVMKLWCIFVYSQSSKCLYGAANWLAGNLGANADSRPSANDGTGLLKETFIFKQKNSIFILGFFL